LELRAGGGVDLSVLAGLSPIDSPAPVLSVSLATPHGTKRYQLCRTPQAWVLRVTDLAEFSITTRQVSYRLLSPAGQGALPWLILGPVLSLWMELRGLLVLHGATVDVDGRAVSFLARSGTGKSSLAGEFVRGGHRVFGDDHVVLESASGGWRVRPALPWLKVHRFLASHLDVSMASLPELSPGVQKRRLDLSSAHVPFTSGPLRRVFVLRRVAASEPIVVTRLRPRDALARLIGYSASPRTVQAAGLQERRLGLLADIADGIGVWSLQYPSGYGHLSEVRKAVCRHLAEQVS